MKHQTWTDAHGFRHRHLNVRRHWLNYDIYIACIKASYSNRLKSRLRFVPNSKLPSRSCFLLSEVESCLQRRPLQTWSHGCVLTRVIPNQSPAPATVRCCNLSQEFCHSWNRLLTEGASPLRGAGPNLPETSSNWTRRLPLIIVSQWGGGNQHRLSAW